jgi:hypothetical protein
MPLAYVNKNRGLGLQYALTGWVELQTDVRHNRF